jgi:hypothetical protein
LKALDAFSYFWNFYQCAARGGCRVLKLKLLPFIGIYTKKYQEIEYLNLALSVNYFKFQYLRFKSPSTVRSSLTKEAA